MQKRAVQSGQKPNATKAEKRAPGRRRRASSNVLVPADPVPRRRPSRDSFAGLTDAELQAAAAKVSAPRERFVVMRVVVPVSMKEFVYGQRVRMGLDTPSAYVRRVLKDLQEAHEEFEYEKHGFGAGDAGAKAKSKRKHARSSSK